MSQTLIFAVIVGAVVASGFFVPSFRPYLRPMPFVAFLLGISSGFPLTLLLATMTFWLSKVGIDKSTIGFAIGLTTPYTLKFLWAPLVDKVPLPVLTRLFGQRRAWLFFIQALLFGAIWQLGASDPATDLARFALWAIAVAFLSATQDIVIDAYRIEILSEQELPHGTAMNQFGYRTGNLLAGAGTIFLASTEGAGLGWAVAYGITAFCVLPAAIGALLAGPGRYVEHRAVREGLAMGDWLKETIVNPFREFLSRHGAFLVLGFVLIYKIGDAMGQVMLAPMIVELGFTDTEYVTVNKFVGFAALIAGSALGAPFIARLGMGRALFVSGAMMMLSNLLFCALAVAGHSTPMLALAVGTENFTSGIGLTVFVTYLSGLSSLAYTATQFALLSSFAAVGRTWLSTPSGYLAEGLGWVGFWAFTVVAAIPGMILLWIMWTKGFVVESVRQPSTQDD
ncbi:PAT family beta-lactamase induction signal transducer AmpG [Sphingobium sp. B2D3A]|uniref:AmpG family muropeptide MFS transporter n=1 Tax=unclassified Sphingobium TaxID=2611147 RepID=UPI00222449DA|nr:MULTISPECIES: MFS transporter [unclassified Sphingobium]MCW2338772.1 PAT family beta-lactamase induction signal transducer AmpG [Sphingobium sp. B2D3A]MCW2338799.1 PAT family beta-lactamase induction signal transducer AmpG [Sphingobium sp. B2D3A]MCW2349759.1 PAT family beta-lactamase induction signal transducer AmpG [Sphingobium sp. B12D2B]MCW2382428.1 PAT family beta-lactamase induction signal transducer AmpG [Sphingobium sp. B2D3B]MCW2385230.1 PAT family beta-lactamase induction signal tr